MKSDVQQEKTKLFSVSLGWFETRNGTKSTDLPTEHQDADKAELRLFRKVKDELTVSDESDVVLKSSRIVVLTVLREKVISLAHEGHQGIVKTKQLLREKV